MRYDEMRWDEIVGTSVVVIVCYDRGIAEVVVVVASGFMMLLHDNDDNDIKFCCYCGVGICCSHCCRITSFI